jgi:hypothetical protein
VSVVALVRVRPLPHDELPMPPQDRVRRDDARDLTQNLPTQPMPTDRQPASIAIGELEPLSMQLASKDPIFLHQIRDRLAFQAIHPASHDSQHHPESGRVDHDRSLYHLPQALPIPSIQSRDIKAVVRRSSHGALRGSIDVSDSTGLDFRTNRPAGRRSPDIDCARRIVSLPAVDSAVCTMTTDWNALRPEFLRTTGTETLGFQNAREAIRDSLGGARMPI